MPWGYVCGAKKQIFFMATNTPTPANYMRQTTPAGSALSNPVQSNTARLTKGNINPNNELVVTLVADATNVNNGNNILIIEGLTVNKIKAALSAAVPDQDHVKLSSSLTTNDADGLADWNRYVNSANLLVRYIRIVTSDTTLYDGNLKFGIMPFNGTSLPAYWPLYGYAKNGSNGYAKDLIIDTMPNGQPMSFPITPNTYLFFDTLPTSATVSIALGIVGDGEQVLNA
jgi:hypothetical protein